MIGRKKATIGLFSSLSSNVLCFQRGLDCKHATPRTYSNNTDTWSEISFVSGPDFPFAMAMRIGGKTDHSK